MNEERFVTKAECFYFEIVCSNNKVIKSSFLNHATIVHAKSPFAKKVERELKEYFSGKRKVFTTPISIKGTEFQKQVWNAIKKIKVGTTCSYGNLSKKIGREKAYRALANACGQNQLPIFIPCHRVVASDSIGGFSSDIKIKKFLLALEQ